MRVTNDAGLNAQAAAVPKAGGFAGGDFETFLKMLTTQIKHQDPLNPMEGSDFAVQLATFSGVEQQAHTNKLIEQFGSQLGGPGLSQLSGWIGKEARSTAPIWFGEAAVTLDIQPDRGADQVILVTYDAGGREVAREAIGPGHGQIDWYGRNADGSKFPDGLYQFSIESLREGEVTSRQAVGAYGRVEEARITNGNIVLLLEGGAEVPVENVSALREAKG